MMKMKLRFKSAIILFCISCKVSVNDGKELKLLTLYRSQKVVLSGKAVKGELKNARVRVFRLKTDGTCDTGGQPLAYGSSENDGSYSLTYFRTGRPVCVVSDPNPSGKSYMHDEYSNTDISFTGNTSYTNVMIEPSGGTKSNVNITPFSRIALSRLSFLAKQNTDSSKLSSLVTYANKQTIVQFGLNKGFSSARSFQRASDPIDMNTIPDILDSGVNLNDSSNSLVIYQKTLLGGFSVLANKTKDGSAVTAQDTEDVVSSYAKDAADGAFDGVDETGAALSISGTNSVSLGNDPLTSTLSQSAAEYLQSLPKTDPILVNSGLSSSAVAANPSSFFQMNETPVFLQEPPVSLKITGTISGLTVSGLTISSGQAGASSVSVSAGATDFSLTGVIAGAAYKVTIVSQPVNTIVCAVNNGSGTITADVTNVSIVCQSPITFIDGNGTNGINYSATSANVKSPFAVSYNNTLTVTWTEAASTQTRAKQYNPSSGAWTFIDPGTSTGINISGNSSEGARLAVFNSKLYGLWSETSVYRRTVGRVYSDTPGTWNTVTAGIASGENKNANADAKFGSAIVFNNKLYWFWTEDKGASLFQIRVKVYNGNDSSPVWTFVDGGGVNGINKDNTKSANNNGADPFSAAVLNGKLYLSWDEFNGSAVSQIRVAVYNGNDAAPVWTFVDGNGVNGLNRNASFGAYNPTLSILNNKLYNIWQEDNGTCAQIRAAVYNGNDSTPSWTFIDGNSPSFGINLNSSKNGDQPHSLVFNGKLYALWNEDNLSAVKQARLAVFNGDDTGPVWKFVDGANTSAGINKNSGQSTKVFPKMAEFNNRLHIVWVETNGSFDQVRAAQFNGN